MIDVVLKHRRDRFLIYIAASCTIEIIMSRAKPAVRTPAPASSETVSSARYPNTRKI